MKELIKQDCLSCVYLNVNGACGNRRSVMYGVITTKPSYPPPNCAMTEDTTTRKPLRNTRENEKYKAYTTMSKLIEEAENLYKQIDKAQVHLINARLNNDEEGKKSAISEMETAMCNVMQLLKCLIGRKDNIVDLSEVWKDDSHIPQTDKKVVVINNNGTFINGYLYIDERTFTVKTDSYRIIISDRSDLYRWAYLDDLFPKGGEK